MQELRGKTAVVTGAASGIGRALALELAAQGTNVVLADVSAGFDDAVAAVRAAGVRALGVRADVADRGAVDALAERAYAEFGTVEILCNNAGVNVYIPLAETKQDDWDWILGINLKGVIHGVGAFLPRLLKQTGERQVVNTASVAGLAALAEPNGTLAPYTTMKYGVVGFSEYLRAALAPSGIGVTVVCPSLVQSMLRASGRWAPSLAHDRPPGPIPVGMEPGLVAKHIVRGIREDAAYVFTDTTTRGPVEKRFAAILAAMDRAADSPE